MLYKDVLCKKHHLAVRIDNLTGLRSYAKTVAIAIKSKPQFYSLLTDGFLEVFQIRRLGWVGMMIREVPVNVCVT